MLPDSFPREVGMVLVLPLNLGDFIFFFICLPFSYVFPPNSTFDCSGSLGRLSDGRWLSPNLPCALSWATCSRAATGALIQLSDLPLPAERSSLLCAIKKKLQNLTSCPWSFSRYARIVWAGSPVYPNWISVPSGLVLTYAVKLLNSLQSHWHSAEGSW